MTPTITAFEHSPDGGRGLAPICSFEIGPPPQKIQTRGGLAFFFKRMANDD